MKKILPLLLAVVFAPFAFSQSTRVYTLNVTPAHPTLCSYTPSAPDCYGIPITDNATGESGQIWLYSSWIQFMSGYQGLGMALVTSNNGTGAVTFKDEATEGKTYTGTLNFTYQTYLCGRWHNQHCWEITGGTLTVVDTN
jgi:hypothetical protein